MLNQTADSSKAPATASPGSFPDDDDMLPVDMDDEPPVLDQNEASWMNLSRDESSRHVSVDGLEDDDDESASRKRKSTSKKPKKKRRKIQMDDKHTELDNNHMKTMMKDTSDVVQKESLEVFTSVDWHQRLLQPALAADGHLAPELQQLWANNLAPAHGKPFPYKLEESVEVARQQEQEEEEEMQDDEMPLPDNDDDEEQEEEEQEDVEIPFPDDDEAPPMPDDFEDMEAMNSPESSISLGLVNDALTEDRQQAGDELVSSSSKWHKHTVKVLNMLQRNMQEPTTALSYDNLAKGCSRRTAAGVFFELLQLKTWDFIELDQKKPYQDITVTQGVKFHQKPPSE